MQVIILGSGSPLPDPNRAGPATLVRTSAGDLLFDCGRGVLMRAAAAGSGAGAFRALFLTHLHSDHITDLNDIYTMRWAMSFQPNPLSVYGPGGTAKLLEATEAMLEPDIGYRLAHHDDLTWRPAVEATEVESGVILEDGAVRVTAAPTDHAPVRPTVGFRIDDGDHSVVIAGDTVPCIGLDELCQDADVLVHTVVRRDLIEQFGLPRLTDVLDYHSSVPDAAETAMRNRVGTLLLTHLVPAPAPGTEDEWIAQASAHYAGAVVLATDLLQLEVGA
ncbi:MAG TPA: MBL fold metallo-hydrolase [Acidimicrobiales bacterium]|jgi:ribonuclease Z|nr:MBL fold metallo-hydrolase [Acidimicrobiales bacterium]